MKEKENPNTEFLNYIYQGAKMGVKAIDDIEMKIEDEKFLEVVKKQRDEYQKINEEAGAIFKKYGKEEKDLSMMTKVSSYMMIMMKTITDHSTNNLAKMMIEGSNKGIIEITEKLNNYPQEDEEIKKLAEKLLAMEKHNLEELKPFL